MEEGSTELQGLQYSVGVRQSQAAPVEEAVIQVPEAGVRYSEAGPVEQEAGPLEGVGMLGTPP